MSTPKTLAVTEFERLVIIYTSQIYKLAGEGNSNFGNVANDFEDKIRSLIKEATDIKEDNSGTRKIIANLREKGLL